MRDFTKQNLFFHAYLLPHAGGIFIDPWLHIGSLDAIYSDQQCGWGKHMPQGKKEKSKKRIFNTTIGEFVEAVYDAAMEEYMDEILARRIAMQMLLRKLRQQHYGESEQSHNREKKAYLRSELIKMRAKKA